ncbi:MAG: glycosyltransferase, exosortase A system-associated [Gammaproteobacteria bacterium]|nr:glycosyltransferase, exosortase A system-associated [Gammaproteobacteria bacterium]MBU1555297.1 glycosyltransferase, exosortase A system-associated [Gammaproteobacteria bacterium]MBU2069233.1 glycosyltransferase, exosortase A system-associated [Gammaproteobacteria bacterium]MBU2182328.1 glycosyltransferase, exosortase A system-associated [Gammaproteobacteria bacterium]MBU2204900.1 glycosyltransferase, exosortase A system-associated [Gammaproteobacteria bacterium]
MKILHIFDHSLPLHSGYTFRSRAILQQQRQMGYVTCHVTSPKHGDCAQPVETVEQLTFYRTKAYDSWFWRLPLLKELAVVLALKRRLTDVIQQEKPDILHAHSPALNGLAALWAARKARLPVVYEIRAFWEDAAVDHGTSKEFGWRYNLTRALETYVARHADAVTTICQGLKQDLVARGIDDSKITEIPNAVDPTQFQPITSRNSELELTYQLKNKPVLGFIGSFYAYEGLDLLLRALPLIRAKIPSAMVLLVGGGPQQEQLKQLISQLKLDDAVLMPGRVPHHQVMQYYSLIDLLVYPRKAMRLTELVTPLKPLEAMAQGKTLLASDVGGHLELIEHGKNGWLFQRDNIEDLAEQAIRALTQRERDHDIAENAYHYINTQRNWAVSVGRYHNVYGRLTGKAV